MDRSRNPSRSFTFVRRGAVSLLCVFGAWCVLSIYVYGHFYFVHLQTAEQTKQDVFPSGWLPARPPWWHTPTMIGAFAAWYIGAIWLFVVLPLFMAVRRSNWLWKWPITMLVFTAVGVLAMLGAIRFQLAPIFSDGVWFAALTGAATGIFASLVQRKQWNA